MSNSSVRRKRDYEDLDKVFEPSDQCGQRDQNLSPLGPQPAYYRSDSAIHVKSKPTKSYNLSLEYSTASSIPCFFRIGPDHSVKEGSRQLTEGMSEEKPNVCGCLKSDRKENYWFFCFVCFYAIYIVIGSFCIQLIEAPFEQESRQNYTLLRDSFIQKYPGISDDLEKFINFVASSNGFSISKLQNFTNKTEWTFGQALFFSTSLVTTIGYGHINPRSHMGKIFCLIFSAFGIPLTLILINAIVERLLTPSNYLLQLLIKKYNYLHKSTLIKIIHLSLLAFLAFILFFAIPIATFSYLEESWSILDSFYFCYMSLTTIGLGDVLPGETTPVTYQSLYKISTSIYLLTGIIGMMVVVTVYYKIPQINIGGLFTQNYKEREKIPQCDVNVCPKSKKTSYQTSSTS